MFPYADVVPQAKHLGRIGIRPSRLDLHADNDALVGQERRSAASVRLVRRAYAVGQGGVDGAWPCRNPHGGRGESGGDAVAHLETLAWDKAESYLVGVNEIKLPAW